MTLTLDMQAELLASSPSRTRAASGDARALANITKQARREHALSEAQRAAQRFDDYSLCDSHAVNVPCDSCQHGRIATLKAHHWPRSRAVRDALSTCDELLKRDSDKRDDAVSLSVREREDVIIRGIRLATLLARVYAATATYGAFPVSRSDMRTDKRTRFIGSAAARHFTFAGGRDWGSSEFDASDIVQGAFIRALENGDTVSGVPTFGSMFRHVQSERARLTNMANAEYAARKRAALGWTSNASERELAAMYPENKHTLRLLGTRNYATLSQHRETLAVAHRDAEMSAMDDYVTRSAREDALDGANVAEYHVIVTRALMGGATLSEISDAIGQRVETIVSDVHKSRAKSLRPLDTYIDHSERSLDMHYAAERERAEDAAEREHAERLRAVQVVRDGMAYAEYQNRKHGVTAPRVADDMTETLLASGERVRVSWDRDNARPTETTHAPEAVTRTYFDAVRGWVYAPDVYRGLAMDAGNPEDAYADTLADVA